MAPSTWYEKSSNLRIVSPTKIQPHWTQYVCFDKCEVGLRVSLRSSGLGLGKDSCTVIAKHADGTYDIRHTNIDGESVIYSNMPRCEINCPLPMSMTKLAITQALGHNGITGYAPDVKTLPIQRGRRYRIVVGSDGFWDMVIHTDMVDVSRLGAWSCGELCDMAAARWKQPWTVVDENLQVRYEFEGFQKHTDWDDVAVSTVDIVPLYSTFL
jgi:hypothetical protein